MDPDVVKMAQVFIVIGGFVAGILILAFVAKVAFQFPRRKKFAADDGVPRIDDSRFKRLEDAVDSIAIEVERIAEAQRFSVKLLSERLTERAVEEGSPLSRRLPPESR
jgi:hypothetical protein